MIQRQLEPGLRFTDPVQLRKLIRCYAVANARPIRFHISAKRRLAARCALGCPLKLWASWMRSERSFQIKTLEDEHRCVKTFTVKLANSAFISELYHDKILANPHWKLVDMKHDILEKYIVWTVQYSGGDQFEVKRGSLGGFVVNLKKKIFTCRKWEVSGIPCEHAIAAIYYKADDPDKGECLVGPRRREGMKSRFEEPKRKNTHRIIKKGGKNECSKCKQLGHNARTCDKRPKAPVEASTRRPSVSRPIVTLTVPVRKLRGPYLKKRSKQQFLPLLRQTLLPQSTRRPPNGFGLHFDTQSGDQYLKLGKRGRFIKKKAKQSVLKSQEMHPQALPQLH